MSRTSVRMWAVAAAAVLALVSWAEPAGEGTADLTADGLRSWRSPTGDWFVAGGARSDPGDPKMLAGEPGKGVIVNGKTGRTTDILSQQEFGDVEAHMEFVVPKGSNSGVYFMGRYEVQVFDSWGVKEPKYSDCGGLYESADSKVFVGRGPSENASRAPGEWQSFDVVFRAPRFDAAGKKTENAKFVRVTHNGKVIHENVEVPGPTRAARFNDEQATGPLMLQGDHGPVAYRHIRVKPLAAAAGR